MERIPRSPERENDMSSSFDMLPAVEPLNLGEVATSQCTKSLTQEAAEEDRVYAGSIGAVLGVDEARKWIDSVEQLRRSSRAAAKKTFPNSYLSRQRRPRAR